MKVIFDVSVLGLGYFHKQARTGIYRVVEQLFNFIVQEDSIEVVFVSPNNLYESMIYLKNNFPKNKKVIFLHSEKDIKKAKLSSFLVSSFPKDSFFQKVVKKGNDLLFKPNTYQIDTHKIPENSVYYSPFHALPTELSLAYIQKVITIYDVIPLLHPEYFHQWNITESQNILNSIDSKTTVLCISEATKTDVLSLKKGIENQVYSIPLAASPTFFYPEKSLEKQNRIREKYKIPQNQNYFLSLATLEPRKNIHRIIQSFLLLKEREELKDTMLVLVGGLGWKMDEIFEEIRKSPVHQESIIATGFVEDEDLAALYSGALAFVYPSLYEGFGLPPLEAMQCGTPVISSSVSSLPEVVGEAGILVSPLDVIALSEAMLSLYESESLRKELSEKALQRASLFSWEKFNTSYLRNFLKLAKNN